MDTDSTPELVVEYTVGGVRRRDVFENGEKWVQQHDYTEEDGTEVWETLVAFQAKVTDIEENGSRITDK